MHSYNVASDFPCEITHCTAGTTVFRSEQTRSYANTRIRDTIIRCTTRDETAAKYLFTCTDRKKCRKKRRLSKNLGSRGRYAHNNNAISTLCSPEINAKPHRNRLRPRVQYVYYRNPRDRSRARKSIRGPAVIIPSRKKKKKEKKEKKKGPWTFTFRGLPPKSDRSVVVAQSSPGARTKTPFADVARLRSQCARSGGSVWNNNA